MMLFKVPVKGSKPQVTFQISSAVLVSVTLEGAVATVASCLCCRCLAGVLQLAVSCKQSSVCASLQVYM